MRIKEIELDNFKSFGKRTVVPLLGGFTTISGPNGSGKSNIIDSLLFALGLSSTRSMRAERLPDLLNNLSGKNEAKVTVRFTDDKGNELEVTRRIRVKENSYTSTYMLNGKNTTLTEIHDELMKYNVSPTGFNVIMQGDVTGIVTMSPSERRKIIDELAGVAEFDRRIDQANDELTSVGEKIDHQRIILTEIAARILTLQTDRDQALKYLDLKKQKESIERDLVFIRVKEGEAKLSAELARLTSLNEREEHLLAVREKAEMDLFQLRSEMGRIDEEIRDKGGNEQILLRQEQENLRGELTREENRLASVTSAAEEKSKLQKSLQAQIKTIDKHINDLNKHRKQSEIDIKSVREIYAEKEAALAKVQAQIDDLRTAKDRSSDKVTSAYEVVQKLREEKHELEVKSTKHTSRREELERGLESLRSFVTTNISKSAEAKGLVLSLERKYTDTQAWSLGMERNIRQLEDEMSSTNEDIELKRKELEGVNRRIIELETHRDVAGESGFGKAVEAILKANIPGVHGTIGQLGNVDPRYTTALEICIGPRLAHIVVDDDQVAQECIEFLKSNRAGRATFVPLNKIVTQPPGLLPDRPGVIDYAYNLIEFDSRYSKAFQYACGQTIVVEDMEVGRKLLGQARMVTLSGELFEKAGSITGGQDTKAKLHFTGSKGENDLNTLQLKSKSLLGYIQGLQDALKELTTTIAEEREKLKEVHAQLAKEHADLDTKRKESENLDKDIEDAKPKLRANGDEIEQIDKDLDQYGKSLATLDKEIAKLHDELADITNSGQSSEIKNLISQAEELQVELEHIGHNVNENQREIDRLEAEERIEQNTRTGFDAQLTEVTKEIDELKVEFPGHTTRIEELKKQIDDIEIKVTSLSNELTQLRELKDQIYEKVTGCEIEKTKIEQDLLHLEEERQKCKLAHGALTETLTVLKVELEQLLAEQPDYEPPNAGTVEQLKMQSDRLEKRMRALEPVNMKALEEYDLTRQRQQEMEDNLLTLTTEKDEILQRIAGYDELKKRTFMESFDAINTNFQQIFHELSHGSGRLELENPEKPFEGGLIIRAQPREKKMQRIEALSGGEKSLTALSFVFAFQRYAPAPFYAFDEVDMMLDGSNAERLARMVKRQSEEAQFVVVSLRRPMIENSNHAIGVSLRADGYSRVVGIQEIQIPDEEQTEEVVGAGV